MDETAVENQERNVRETSDLLVGKEVEKGEEKLRSRQEEEEKGAFREEGRRERSRK